MSFSMAILHPKLCGVSFCLSMQLQPLFSSLFPLLRPARATQSSGDCDPRSNDEKHHTSSNDSSDEHILAINGNLCCGFDQKLSRGKREVYNTAEKLVNLTVDGINVQDRAFCGTWVLYFEW